MEYMEMHQQACKILSKQLKRALKINKITQIELANKSGVSICAINMIINYKQLPGTINILLLCKALNITPSFLLGYI